MKPHVHAELIKAWADGAEIEIFHKDLAVWVPISPPSWVAEAQYRIKPQPKPDVVVECYGFAGRGGGICSSLAGTHNLRLTFDGDTGQLKYAEVIKCT